VKPGHTLPIETLIAESETQFNAPRWSPDGRSIAVERHQLGGLSEIVIVDVATKGLRTVTPYGGVRAVTPAWRPDGHAVVAAAALEPLDHEPRPYSPWPTLRPTSWTPIVEGDSTQVRVGAAAAGFDVLGYHAYVASASWLVSGPAAAEKPGAATPDWTLFYAYNRWRPTVWAAASSATSFFSGPPTASGTTSNATLRERRLEAGVR